jgi:hypothetical protein
MNRERTTTAILVFCVLLVGAAGVGAAATTNQTSITLDQDVYYGNDVIRVTLADSTLSTDTDHFVSIFSDTESRQFIQENVPGGVTSYTTKEALGERINSAQISVADGDFDYTPDASGVSENDVIDRVAYNQDNTLTLFFTDPAQSSGSLRYVGSETVTLTHAGGTSFTGIIDIRQTDSLGILNASFGDTVTVQYYDVNAQEHRTDTASVQPKILQIKTIAEQPQLVNNNTNVTIRLFEQGQQGQQRIITRVTSDGNVSLAGSPANAQYTVVAEASGFVTRRTFIDDFRQQHTIYLLDDQTETSLVRFSLEDRTGQFSGDQQTTLKIQRTINTTDSGEQQAEYQTVSGDFVGGQLTFDSQLETNTRYRVSVSNQDGDTRQLGAFFVKGPRQINLVISGIDQGVDVPKEGPVISTTQQTQNNSKTLDFVYTDNASKTSKIIVRVENARNSSEVFDRGSERAEQFSGDISQFKFSTTVTGDDAEKQIVANYTYVRDGQTEQATQPYGSNTYPVLTELDQGWASIFGVGFLIITGSLFSVRNARIGALVIPGVALLLNLVGILDGVVTLASVGLAFSIGIGVNLISNGFLR